MKHAKPNKSFTKRFKENFKSTFLLFLAVIMLIAAMIFGIFAVYEYANSGLPGYEERPYFSVEPWTMGVELVTEKPDPTYPKYFTYNTEETKTNG